MTNIRRGLLCAVVVAVVLAAAGVTGKWTGTAEVKLPDGGTRSYALEASFSQNGEDVSGSIGQRDEGESIVIQKGKMQGARLSFEVVPPEASGPVKFELELHGENLEGQLSGQVEGGTVSGNVSLTRSR